jgi:hypothetical protein
VSPLAFRHDDLPDSVQPVARRFQEMFHLLRDVLPDGGAKRRALDKLLEARAAALRATMPGLPGDPVQKPPGGNGVA